MGLLVTEDDSAFAQVVWADCNGDVVTEHDANPEPPQLASQVGVDFSPRIGFHEEVSPGEDFFDLSFDLDQVIGRQAHLRPPTIGWVRKLQGATAIVRYSLFTL